MKEKNITLVGGAGYIGLTAASFFLDKGYKVLVLDNLIYNQENFLRPFLLRENFKFVNYDFRDEIPKSIQNELQNVVFLGGLVGDPITKKYPEISFEINDLGVQSFIKQIKKLEVEKFIFISTCSNYGLIEEDIDAKEDHPLKPLSLYSESKVKNELYILENNLDLPFCSSILRFATAFGAAPRMRFDLTVNEFVKDLFMGKKLDVYDPDTWRPYCHVQDFAQLIFLVINASEEIIDGEVFNAGSDENNFTKRQIIEIISKEINSINVNFLDKGFDRRNYKVNFEKAKSILNFSPSWSVPNGVKEIISYLKQGMYSSTNENDNLFGNYKL